MVWRWVDWERRFWQRPCVFVSIRKPLRGMRRARCDVIKDDVVYVHERPCVVIASVALNPCVNSNNRMVKKQIPGSIVSCFHRSYYILWA